MTSSEESVVMKKISCNVLAASIASILAAPGATALDVRNSEVCVVASEQKINTTNGTKLDVNNCEKLVYKSPNAATVTGDNSYFVYISLSSGAKFGSTGVQGMGCFKSGASAAATTVNLNVARNGANGATAFFQYTMPSTGTEIGVKGGAVCSADLKNASTGIVVLNSKSNVTVTIHTKYLQAGSFVSSFQSYPYVQFKQGLFGKASPTGAAGAIDVQNGSMLLTTAAVSTKKLYAGSVSYSTTAGSSPYLGSSTVISTSANAATFSSPWAVSVTGAPIEAASKVTIQSTNACTGGTIYGSASPASGSQAVAISVTAGTFPGTAHVCVEYDGTKSISAGLITASLQSAETNYELNTALVPNELYELQKNGAQVEVDMMTPSTGIYPTYVRFTNPSSTSGKVYVKAYNDDGTMGASIFSFDLAAGQSKMFNASVIEQKTGVAPLSASNDSTTGAMKANKIRLYVEGEFDEIGVQVMNLALDATYFGQLTSERKKSTEAAAK
jgi:hypothetical protein